MNAQAQTGSDAQDWLLAHVHDPFALAERANAIRRARYADRIALRTWAEHTQAPQRLLWEGQAPRLGEGDDNAQTPVALVVDCDTHASRTQFLAWLTNTLSSAPVWDRVSAWSLSASSTQRSWLSAALRILCPPTTRIEARVDILGLRSAQLCLNFGVDTLASHVAAAAAGSSGPGRKLPIAGVTSPHEHSRVGLVTLIEQAGLRPDDLALSDTRSP